MYNKLRACFSLTIMLSFPLHFAFAEQKLEDKQIISLKNRGYGINFDR